MASIGPLVVIVGETASGKSALALELAKRFNGEIICADARTIYRGLDIGTAKPTKTEQAEIRHHLLDVVRPDERFTAVDFKRLAETAIEDIAVRGKLPIMVGGTGLYIDALLFNYSFDSGPERDPVNPRHAKQRGGRSAMRSNTLVIGLELDKTELERRIQSRVEAMVKAGFIEEVRQLSKIYDTSAKAFDTPGYRPFLEYLESKISLEEAKTKFAHNDLRLAKRQKTWFKRNKNIQWLNDPCNAVEIVTTFLNNLSNKA